MSGTVLGGWLLVRSALAARVEETGIADAKAASARFYATQVLPTAAGLGPAVTGGAAALPNW